MISLVRWLAALVIRRFRWVALGALVRSLTRRTRERSVDAATQELARKLPPAVVKAADAVPGDLLRQGGRAVATGRNARHIGSLSRRIGAARRHLRLGHWGAAVAATRTDWKDESALAERELWSDYHRVMGDPEAADDILLDRLQDRKGPHRSRRPVAEVPPPIPAGRPSRTPRPRAAVQRVQRSYRRAKKPWDLPGRQGYERQ